MDPASRRNLALVGMMGSGKSAVGALLAERLGWTFYDTDLLLEGAFGKPVGRIFERPGEATFRAAEALLVRSLMSLECAVLATGGGLWMSGDSRRRLSSFAYTVYLAAPPDVLWRRLSAQAPAERPLLSPPDPRAELERILKEREPVYSLADWRIECGLMDPYSVVQQLLRRLRAAGLIVRSGEAA
jgi:shikimate kinase